MPTPTPTLFFGFDAFSAVVAEEAPPPSAVVPALAAREALAEEVEAGRLVYFFLGGGLGEKAAGACERVLTVVEG